MGNVGSEVRLTEHELFFVTSDLTSPSVEQCRLVGVVASPSYLADLKDSYVAGIRAMGEEPTDSDLLAVCDDGFLLMQIAKNLVNSGTEPVIPTADDTVPGAFATFLGNAGIASAEPKFPHNDFHVIAG